MLDISNPPSTEDHTLLISIGAVLAKNVAVLMAMALFIIFQETFIVFILWLSAFERTKGIDISAKDYQIIISTVFIISIISFILFIFVWIRSLRKGK